MSRRTRKGGGRELEVRITAMGARGDGLAQLADGTPLFVPHALPRERVRLRTAAKTDAGVRGHVLELLEESADRVEPTCPNSPQCGGCVFQHWSPSAQRAWKQDQVIQAVTRAGFDPACVTAMQQPIEVGRRRARFLSQGGKLGFRERRSHALIAKGPCQTLGPELASFWTQIQGQPVLAKTADWTVTATPAGLDLAVESLEAAPDPLSTQDLVQSLDSVARLSWNAEVLLEVDAPRIDLGGDLGSLAPILPPGGFLQPSLGGQQALQDLVLESIPREARWVADLYCGIGTFAIPLATRGHRVQALESYEPSLAALDTAVRRDPSNAFKIHVGARNLDLYPLQEEELGGFDALVFDPPRAGARSQARRIAGSSIPTVVSVSCNPATWARDAKLLKEGGYDLRTVTPVDQFPQTPHLELVAVFEK